MTGTARITGSRFRFCSAGICWLGLGLLAALEICCIPTAARKLKTGCRHLLGKRLLAACGASCQIGLANLAHHLGLMAATCTFVIVNWHKITAISFG